MFIYVVSNFCNLFEKRCGWYTCGKGAFGELPHFQGGTPQNILFICLISTHQHQYYYRPIRPSQLLPGFRREKYEENKTETWLVLLFKKTWPWSTCRKSCLRQKQTKPCVTRCTNCSKRKEHQFVGCRKTGERWVATEETMKQLRSTLHQIKELKVPLSRWILELFSPWVGVLGVSYLPGMGLPRHAIIWKLSLTLRCHTILANSLYVIPFQVIRWV